MLDITFKFRVQLQMSPILILWIQYLINFQTDSQLKFSVGKLRRSCTNQLIPLLG